MNHNRYAFLDGIRGMAAIFVMTRHTVDYWHLSFYRSYLAVDLFFILSGFVIAYAYDEKVRTGIITFPKFVLIRLIRLYPVFILSVLISSALFIGRLTLKHEIDNTGLLSILSVVAFTSMFLPSHIAGDNGLFPINGVYWSLFFELVVNFLYAAIRPVLNNYVLAAIVLGFGFLMVRSSYLNGNLDTGFYWEKASFIAGFARSIFGIFLGLLLFRHHSRFKFFLDKPYVAWIAVFAIAIVLGSPSVEGFNWIIDAISVAVIFPIAVLAASHGKSTKLQGLLVMLGAASYPVYVLHIPVGEILAYPIKRTVQTFAPISGVVLVVILIVLSVWLEKYYDIPLRKRISNYFFKKDRVVAGKAG